MLFSAFSQKTAPIQSNFTKSPTQKKDTMVELKLMSSPNTRCHKIVWSQDPQKVPQELEGRISAEEWANTCGLVDRFYRQQRKTNRKFRDSMNKIRIHDRPTVVSTEKWVNVVLAKEQQKYLSRGVDVSLIMAKGQEFPMGLCFEVVSQ